MAARLRNDQRLQALMRPASHATPPARFLAATLRERLQASPAARSHSQIEC